MLELVEVVLGGWLTLRVATHPLSLYLCFMSKTGCRLLLRCGG